jgi:hypothetical protein
MLLDESVRKSRSGHYNDNLTTGDFLWNSAVICGPGKVKGAVATKELTTRAPEPTKLALDLLSYVCISGSDLSFIAHADRSDVGAETSISVL